MCYVDPRFIMNFIWVIYICCSAKFGQKIMYVNYLHELGSHVNLHQLNIPEAVKE